MAVTAEARRAIFMVWLPTCAPAAAVTVRNFSLLDVAIFLLRVLSTPNRVKFLTISRNSRSLPLRSVNTASLLLRSFCVFLRSVTGLRSGAIKRSTNVLMLFAPPPICGISATTTLRSSVRHITSPNIRVARLFPALLIIGKNRNTL